MMHCVPSPDVVCARAPDPHALLQVHPALAGVVVFALVALLTVPMAVAAMLAARGTR